MVPRDQDIRVETYPEESWPCRKWTWKIWHGPDLLGQGSVVGSDAHARAAANRALVKLRRR